MIQAAFSAAGNSNLVFVDGTIDSVRYVEILQNTLQPFIVSKHDYDCWFQLNKAKSNAANHIIEYFTELGGLFVGDSTEAAHEEEI